MFNFNSQNVLGKSSSTVYAIALLASGQSSTITGTYAGQFIMQVSVQIFQYIFFVVITELIIIILFCVN